MFIKTEFRLKTALKLAGIDEPTVVTPDLEEPVKWADVPLIGSVDDVYHGLNYAYSEGSIKLDFTCESALELLLHQYRTYGTDADVEFHVVDIKRDGTEKVSVFSVDFTTVEIHPGKLSASVIQKSIGRLIHDRFDSDVDLSRITTLDGVPIIPPSPHTLTLTGQTLHETGQFRKQGRFTENQTFQDPDFGRVYYLLPNMNPPTPVAATPPASGDIGPLSDLKGVNQVIGGFAPTDPFGFPLINAETPGSYYLEVDWLFRINTSLTKKALQIGKAKFLVYRVQPVIVIRQAGKDDQTINLCPVQSASGYVISAEHLLNGTYSGNLELAEGDQVFVFTVIHCTAVQPAKQIDMSVDTLNLRVLVDRKTRAKATRTNAYSLPEALQHSVGVITSAVGNDTGTGRVYGSLIDRASNTQAFDGPATEYDVVTGEQLRGLPKAPSYTVKTLMGTLSALHNAGILYERDPVTQVESMRVEPGEWFYRGGEILKIDDVFEYREEPDKDQLFSKIEVGYEKYPHSGPGVADEFNTIRTYQTPLVKSEAKLEIKCPLIGAGTAIEEARRLGIKKIDANGKEVPTTSDAGTYDDDGFIIHTVKAGYSDQLKFIIEPPQPFPDKPYEAYYIQFLGGIISRNAGGISLKEGDSITITGTGTTNDGKSYVIAGSDTGFRSLFNPTYEVINGTPGATPMVSTGVVAATWQLDSQPANVRTNERLDVEGVTDPETVYNLEITPRRMMGRHARFINSGLAYKQAIDELQCITYKGNGRLVTQVKSSVAPLPGDSARSFIRDTGNVALGAFEGFDKLFYPELIYCKVRLTREELELLFDQMQNRGPEGSRLGYVSVLNPDGNYAEGFLRQITYTRNSEVADMVLRKRRPADPAGGPTCGDYRKWNFGRFETDKSADPNLYRFCRFDDFD